MIHFYCPFTLTWVAIILPLLICKTKPEVLTNLRKCKITYSGGEYMGNIAETVSGVLCQRWTASSHTDDITDADFPDISKKLARNYCRNPKQKMSQPWCYVLNSNELQELCDVPICQYQRCKISGPGIEYMGMKDKTLSGLTCLNWSDYHIHWNTIFGGERIFPDGDEKLAGNKCRNPSNDPGGPWCITGTKSNLTNYNSNINDGNDYNIVDDIIYTKQYCQIPFCDSPGGLVTVSKGNENSEYYTHFTRLQMNTGKIHGKDHKNVLQFHVKLWYPDKWKEATIRIALTTLPIPVSSSQLRMWNIGFEIIINNNIVTINSTPYKEPSLKRHPGLLVKSVKWLQFSLSWDDKHIYLNSKEKPDPLCIHDFLYNNETIINFNERQMYYSIIASPFVWNFPISISDSFCEEFVTTGFDYSKIRSMRETEAGHEILFWVRVFRLAIVKLYPAPLVDYPYVEVSFFEDESELTVSLINSEESEAEQLIRQKVDWPLSYWKWINYKIIIEGETLLVQRFNVDGVFDILALSRHVFKLMKWFSTGTKNTVAHWTFFCSPEDKYPVPKALPPECVGFSNRNYYGTDWISKDGLPCVPWVALSDVLLYKFKNRKVLNYCRQVSDAEDQTYCYAVDIKSDFLITKEKCKPRKCIFDCCRKSGIGNDFVGQLTSTLNQRTCQYWTNISSKKELDHCTIDTSFLENSVINASNNCRNPSKDSAGLWCFTLDGGIPVDLCDVPDCDKPSQRTIIIKGTSSVFEQKFVVTPKQRTAGVIFWIKNWDSSNSADGTNVYVSMKSINTRAFFYLSIGGADNEKLSLIFYLPEKGYSVLLKEKIIPNILSSGHWKGFRLHITDSSVSVENFNDESKRTSLLQWTPQSSSCDQELIRLLSHFTFDYISFVPSKNHRLGLHFNCTGVCLTEVKNDKKYTTFYPVALWKKKLKNNKLTLYLSTNGSEVIFNICLFNLLETKVGRVIDMKIRINQSLKYESYIELVRGGKVLNGSSIPSDFIKRLLWTEIKVSWSDYEIKLLSNKTVIIQFSVNNSLNALEFFLIFYYLSVSVDLGEIIWTANCVPSDLKRSNDEMSASPVDGNWSNWSKWDCSASCGGGIGQRTRKCTNPTPTIFGRFCDGSDIKKGICNTLPCGLISRGTLSMIEDELRNSSYNIEIMVKHRFVVNCSVSILTEIKKESPESMLVWQKDGRLIKTKKKFDNICPDKESITVESANHQDTGLYLCAVESPRDGSKHIIRLTAVVIKNNKYTRYARTTNYLSLKCGGTVLGYVYSNLDLTWMHDGKISKHYYASPLSAVNIENIGPLNTSNTGVWECIIRQQDLNLHWKTQWIFLNVRRTPTYLTNLAQYTPLQILLKFINSDAIILIILFLIFTISSLGIVLIIFLVLSKKMNPKP